MKKIYVKNVSKSFGSKKVLQNLNLTIEPGKISCIMAPSGAGKTMLLRILMGLEEADSGCITGLEGKRFSAVFQEERLCEYMTAVENIRSAGRATQGVIVMRFKEEGDQVISMALTQKEEAEEAEIEANPEAATENEGQEE